MTAAALRAHPAGLGKWFGIGLFVVVAALVAHQARHVDWAAVGSALRGYDAATLLGAAALAAVSHALYACYDLIARRLTGHGVAAGRVLAIASTSYAFTLNLGSLVGGFATRYRLYAGAGLELAQIAQVIAVAITTNWFGYLALAGVLLSWQPPALPPDWFVDGAQLRWAGLAMLALAATYLLACTFAPQRVWRWRGHSLTTPSVREALLQLVVSSANWAVIACLVWLVLQRQVEFTSVATVLLVAVVAGLIVRVPAGVGVLEAVFVALLSHRVPVPTLLAALIVYRVIYYLVPLAVAGVQLLRLEALARRGSANGQTGAAPRTRAEGAGRAGRKM